MENQVVELSLHSMVGINFPKMLKLKGSIQDRDVAVMVDLGATHNFISERLVDELQILVEYKSFAVILGNGSQIKGQGICSDVKLCLGGIEVTQRFFPFSLGSVDVILGVERLESLGEIRDNWKAQTMRFLWQRQSMKLQGDLSLAILGASFSSIVK